MYKSFLGKTRYRRKRKKKMPKTLPHNTVLHKVTLIPLPLVWRREYGIMDHPPLYHD